MIEAIMMTLISNLFETLGLMISIDKGFFIKVHYLAFVTFPPANDQSF